MTSAPVIPDHEVLRVIGRGSYGVIWLARTLTGRLRAVKVIDRSNFDNERTFQREFDGMSAFEPISRAHPGFVNILHVGRGDGFFYYIMEIADDVERGPAIDIDSYVPRTLKSELDRRGRLPASECIEIGLKLTEALEQLHHEGLIHRDIKPANLIFVHGVPKLADIGLVATSGQYSFVGTEGYVPPEGPGTAQADVFSLGKVLYEMTMGKDRLDFPEVATAIDETDQKTHVMGLNEILLRACAARLTRRYASAREMHDDLVRLREGKRPARRLMLMPILAALGIAGAVLGGWILTHPATPGHNPPTTPTPAPVVPPTPEPAINATLRVETVPPGGHVVVAQGERVVREGTAPLTVENLPPGTYSIRGTLDLARAESTETIEAGSSRTVALTFPTGNGTVKITSSPGGAEVFEDGVLLGTTSLLLEDVEPGTHSYSFRLDGYKNREEVVKVAPGGEPVVLAVLEHDVGPEPDKPWTNSLGMVFVPVGDVLFSIWETRIGDYAAFCADTGRAAATADFAQGDTDPVVLVSWHDATDFCEWLTSRERAEGKLNERQEYRLPTDLEWSEAAGLPEEAGKTPEERDGRFHGLFPWGKQWPPPGYIGNYADKSLRKDFIPGYDDGFPRTSPVGTFAANSAGIFDLGGNVWEWCLDRYKGDASSHDWGVLRGGSYANRKKTELELSYRNVVSRDYRDVILGFRCVIAPTGE